MAFYISKYNEAAFKELGYDGPISKAMDDLSMRIIGLDVMPNTYIKQRRDEFDVCWNNGRVGRRNRKPTAAVKEMYEQ